MSAICVHSTSCDVLHLGCIDFIYFSTRALLFIFYTLLRMNSSIDFELLAYSSD